ncbi:hypothetical protein FPH17_02750 [Corynebacterium godavarianum]|uniref:Uncharacterized protein n=1 Tax=Corynebacterium godavarianum TaxID=2054421 RepID=A0ABY3E6B3_9CORY|nr:hypothetical protein [Corynebacterium godavarianum]MBL7285815.1 hypothetical protein [Corynebacterium godavarianum]TSJ75358.1 hypothetical protein FPH17_02750 [Corynebacterium godavarianum]
MTEAGTSTDSSSAVAAQPQIDDHEVEQEGASSIDALDFPTQPQRVWWKEIFRFRHRRKDPSREELENGRYESDTRNRNIYAWVLLGILIAQLIAAHYLIYRSATGSHDPSKDGFYLSDQVLMAYMGSVVVEVIGLVYGIVRGIFPNSDQ